MTLLAADLDGRIVVLDAAHVRLILLDARSQRIWRACSGRTRDEIAAAIGETVPALTPALEELAGAGLISASDGRWTQAPVTWV
jgi:DNA-binding transcriptional ArsR family regulator